MQLEEFNQDLLEFLRCSPTPFHAVEQMSARLSAAGFTELQEQDDWQLPAGKYFVTRNGSSIVAFNKGESAILEGGFRMVGAHTDSPCLKVKPAPELLRQGYFQLGVEVYGGVLLNPWFDRDLSLAGRVTFKSADGIVASVLIDFQRPIATIPSLAIHLDREANSNRSINAQKDIPPIVMQAEDTVDFRQLLLAQVLEQHPDCKAQQVLDYELGFYDCQAPALVGFNQEFIAAARLDNLLSCFIGLQALLQADQEHCVLVCNDHEEVGSQSAAGAQGPMLKSVLRRFVNDDNQLTRTLDRSMMISVDNAHGIHPNFADRHDGNHGPLLNKGVVIKLNANQRYASNSETSALFRHWGELEQQPIQSFVVRSDMGCGSTIGPITAGGLGIKTLDIGVPTFAMHSIRELAGSSDAFSLYKILCRFNHSDNVTVA